MKAKIFITLFIICALGTSIYLFVYHGDGFLFLRMNDESYIEACEQGDYEKAYSIVNGIRTDMLNYKNRHAGDIDTYSTTNEKSTYNALSSNYEKASAFVVRHEATHILETQGVDGLTKISFIAKEHKADWLYKEMLSLAKNMGNKELVNAMMEKWNLWDDNMVRAMISEGKNEPVFALLQSLGTFSMPAMEIEYDSNDFKKILSKISTYNNHCKFVVESAIMYKQKDIALFAIMLMKPKIFYRENSSHKVTVHEPRNDHWDHEDPNEEINAMKAKVAEAEKAGMFK